MRKQSKSNFRDIIRSISISRTIYLICTFVVICVLVMHLDVMQGQEILLTDTVGFISKLPTDLIAAFRATLEEVVLNHLSGYLFQ